MKSVCLMQDFQAVGAQACKDTLQKLFRDKDILKVTMDGPWYPAIMCVFSTIVFQHQLVLWKSSHVECHRRSALGY